MKNKILLALSWTAVLAVIISACMLDSEDIRLPVAVGLTAITWLAIFAKVNPGWYEPREIDDIAGDSEIGFEDGYEARIREERKSAS